MGDELDELRAGIKACEDQATFLDAEAKNVRRRAEELREELSRKETYGGRVAAKLFVPNSSDPRFGVMVCGSSRQGSRGFRDYTDNDEDSRDELLETIRERVAAAIDTARRDAFNEAARMVDNAKRGSFSNAGVYDLDSCHLRLNFIADAIRAIK